MPLTSPDPGAMFHGLYMLAISPPPQEGENGNEYVPLVIHLLLFYLAINLFMGLILGYIPWKAA